MIKWIGAILILCAAGGTGIGKTLHFYRQLRQLNQMLGALEIIKCELNYTLRPLPQLCKHTAERTDGAVSCFFAAYADHIEAGLPRNKAAEKAIDETPGLSLPNDAMMVVLELCSTIGRYDLDGENRMLQLSAQRLKSAIERFDSEKRPLAKSCGILGVASGIAMIILFV